MRAVVLLMFWMQVINIACRLLFLAAQSYPRKRDSVDAWEDALGIVINVGFAVWCWSVLP